MTQSRSFTQSHTDGGHSCPGAAIQCLRHLRPPPQTYSSHTHSREARWVKCLAQGHNDHDAVGPQGSNRRHSEHRPTRSTTWATVATTDFISRITFWCSIKTFNCLFPVHIKLLISLQQYVLLAASDSSFNTLLHHLGYENITFPHSQRKLAMLKLSYKIPEMHHGASPLSAACATVRAGPEPNILWLWARLGFGTATFQFLSSVETPSQVVIFFFLD